MPTRSVQKVTFGTIAGDAAHLPRGEHPRDPVSGPIRARSESDIMQLRRLVACLSASLLLSGAAAAADGLHVTVSDIRNADGHVLILVSPSNEAWEGSGKPAAVARLAAAEGSIEHVFPDLAPGDYAVQVMHDENDNGDLDSNFLGIPVEGYGFSQNPSVMRRATFDEARFALPAEGTAITVRLR